MPEPSFESTSEPQAELPKLPTDLPDHLYWLTEQVQSLVRPAAFLSTDEKRVAPLGGTFLHGTPDTPLDASWASGRFDPDWAESSPYDGPSHWLQLNLADIPEWARKPEWPTVGVVWLFIETQGKWQASVFHDPRPASSIPWRPRNPAKRPPRAVTIQKADTLLWATDKTLPDISADWREGGLAGDFDEWVWTHFGSTYPTDVQLGGWVMPCQGDSDHRNETFMVGFSNQEFGDCGACYLHYDSKDGFFGIVETH